MPNGQPAAGRKQKKAGASPAFAAGENAADQPVVREAVSEAKKRQFERHWNDWDEMANFFVSFGFEITKEGEKRLQTRTIHYESVQEKKWEKIAATELLEWMLAQAKPSFPSEAGADAAETDAAETDAAETDAAEADAAETDAAEADAAETDVAEAGAAAADAAETDVAEADAVAASAALPPAVDGETPSLELYSVEVSEVTIAPQAAGQASSATIRVESWLKLADSARALSDNQVPFRVEAFLFDLEIEQSRVVAAHPGQLKPGELTYRIEQDFPMPAVGRYQLYLAAQLPPPWEHSVRAEGPIIRVEA